METDPQYTSQDCSACGARRSKPDDAERWRCEACGVVHDRDVNAAVNVDRAGIFALGSRSGGVPPLEPEIQLGDAVMAQPGM